jgi:hypothetical protein
VSSEKLKSIPLKTGIFYILNMNKENLTGFKNLLGCGYQPSTINHQPSTINHQPSTNN